MSAFPNGAGDGAAEELDSQLQGEVPNPAGEGVAETPAGGTEPGLAEAPGGGLGAPEDDLARLAAERDEYLEALRRLQAEFDNFRKRTTRQQTELLDRATEGLLERLLPVLDAIDLAQQHRSGAQEGGGDDGAAFDQITSLLKDALSRDGLERIDAAGVHFDPEIHDAVAHLPAPEQEPSASGGEDAPGEPGANGAEGVGVVVTEVLRAGYRLKGRVLRPAMVAVQG